MGLLPNYFTLCGVRSFESVLTESSSTVMDIKSYYIDSQHSSLRKCPLSSSFQYYYGLILFCSVQYNPLLSFFFLRHMFSQIWPMRFFSNSLLSLLDLASLFFEHFFLFSFHSKLLLIHFKHFMTKTHNQPFHKGAVVSNMVFRSQNLRLEIHSF